MHEISFEAIAGPEGRVSSGFFDPRPADPLARFGSILAAPPVAHLLLPLIFPHGAAENMPSHLYAFESYNKSHQIRVSSKVVC
jgi:hypothetical protein